MVKTIFQIITKKNALNYLGLKYHENIIHKVMNNVRILKNTKKKMIFLDLYMKNKKNYLKNKK